MGYLPISLEVAGRRCIVVGGGAVAERKVHALLEAEAAVTVVSPTLTERLESWSREGKICHVGRDYQKGDLVGFQIAFSATNDREVNASVYEEGKSSGVWVNVADDPEHCDFILPSVLHRGPLAVAITTGGTSPALSRAIREELEGYFGEEYATLGQIVGEVRRELKHNAIPSDADAWHGALNGEFRSVLRKRGADQAKKYLLRKLGA